MSDFAQTGVICTLQRLNEVHLAPLDSEWLPDRAARCPISLILPCHSPDLQQPALRHICEQLAGAQWLQRVVIPINGLPPSEQAAVRSQFAKQLPIAHTLLFTDAPPLNDALALAAGRPKELLRPGKGLNVWAALGWLHAQHIGGIYALQDADVLSFNRPTLARLCFALAEEELQFDFAKMYYSRVTDRLYGRVSRLFLTPVLHSLVRVLGHHPLLDFLLGFRYPLAGECALRASLASSLPVHEGWSLEMGMLCEVFRRIEPSRVCQVDGGTGYDHKHQPATGGLLGMCEQIATTLLQQLSIEGCKVDHTIRETLLRTLQRETAQAVKRSNALARLNGITSSPSQEIADALHFTNTLPSGTLPAPRALPSWETVERLQPFALELLFKHAELQTT